jgi:hypoxanthine phosphoribosyltransferase
MSSDKAVLSIVRDIDSETKVIALVVLVVNVGLVAVCLQLPSDKQFYGLIVCAVVLVASLLGAVLLAYIRSQHRDRSMPEVRLADQVSKLRDRLHDAQFDPQLIVAVARGGLAVAGILARLYGNDNPIPVISISPTNVNEFRENAFNCINFSRNDFLSTTSKINVLIVDDVSQKGTTLNNAKTFVEKSLEHHSSDFDVRTAALVYKLPSSDQRRQIAPGFYVDRRSSGSMVRDSSGDIE